jgi:hypothetical protein
MNHSGWIFIALGLFSAVCAAFDFEWFMNHRKARFFVKILGRMGARIFYVLLGAAILVLGGLILFRVVNT